MRTQRTVVTLAATTVVVAIAAIATTTLRVAPGARSAPSASASSSAAAATAPGVVFARSVVLDWVPGGGAVTTSAYDSFEIVTPGGASLRREVAGVAIGTPVFDGRARVAYWRRASITRTPLGFSGPYEVVVWDIRADQERVLLTLVRTDEGSGGDLRWSADAKSLIVPTRTVRTGGGESRVLLVDVGSGATRVLQVASPDAIIAPIHVDAQIIVGVGRSSFVVLDAVSGAVRSQTPLRTPTAFLGESAHYAISPDGMVLELVRTFEQEAGPLRVWNVHDPATVVAKVDERGVNDPRFWPGRTEIVFSGPTGFAALDYRTGRTRPLAGSRAWIEAVDSGGRFALVRSDVGLQIVERVGDELRTRTDLQLIAEATLTPLGIVLP